MDLWPILQGLWLVLAANGTPVLATRLFGERASQPIDFRLSFLDGRRLFGPSKTIRGIIFSILGAALAAPMVGVAWEIGLRAGVAAMAGDLLSSFIKRRLGLSPQSMALGLDQIPESLFPLLACKGALGLSFGEAFIGAGLFWIGELALSRAAYALKIRDRPY